MLSYLGCDVFRQPTGPFARSGACTERIIRSEGREGAYGDENENGDGGGCMYRDDDGDDDAYEDGYEDGNGDGTGTRTKTGWQRRRGQRRKRERKWAQERRQGRKWRGGEGGNRAQELATFIEQE